MKLPINEYAEFLSYVAEAGLREDFINLLRTQSLVDDETIEMPDTKLYDIYLHMGDENQIISAMRFYSPDALVDGSESIKISKAFPVFPRYDTVVSPIVQTIVDKINELVPEANGWEATLNFTKIENFWQCSLTGSYTSMYNATSGKDVSVGGVRTYNLSSVAMAPDIPTVLHSIRLSLPRLFQR